MLILKGKIVHKNLSTTYTHIDQLLEKLLKEQFTGYCTVSFWEYDGVIFFTEGRILNGLEELGGRGTVIRSGDMIVENILTKAQEPDGAIDVYTLPAENVVIFAAALDVTVKHENLSTDLTSLDNLLTLLKKEILSGYIEVVLGNEAGIANLFLVKGDLIESVFAPSDIRLIGNPMSVEDVLELCQTNDAIFNVYQLVDKAETSEQGTTTLKGTVPPDVVNLFEAILIQLESLTDEIAKPGTFQTVFKKILPQVADTHEFLDPFLGDFRYASKTLSYTGDATYKEFVGGLCDLLQRIMASLFEIVPRPPFLLRISHALEPILMQYAEIIEQLTLETQLPELFQDYALIGDQPTEEKPGKKGAESRSVLNLQGVGMSDIGADNMLREFYRTITTITNKYYSAEENAIHYITLKKSREYQQYQTVIAFFQNFTIPALRSRHDLLAFWLNLYNFLVIDGILKNNVKTGVRDVKDFFSKVSYRLGEYLFSLDDIAHGILRNNQRRPYALARQFSGSDPRKTFCLNPPDYRVHCCIVSGTQASPALTVYTPDKLDEQLDQAVARFLTSAKGMHVDREKRELWLNRIFYWYRKDFEQGGKTLIDFVIAAVQDRDLKQFMQQNRTLLTLRFMDYNWSLNGK